MKQGQAEEVFGGVLELFFALKKTFQEHHAAMDCDGLTKLRLGALGILSKRQAMPSSELARLLRISKPQATSLVDGLVASGNVVRSPSATDRRVVEVAITAEGRAALERRLASVHAGLAARLEKLGEDEVAALCAALKTLTPLLAKLQE